MEKVRHQTDLKIITNNGTSDTRCLLRKCVVKDTLFLWDSCQNLQPESHERPSEEPGWGTFYKIAGRYASEMSRAWETCRDTQINAKGYLDWLPGQKKKMLSRTIRHFKNQNVGLHLSSPAQPLFRPTAPRLHSSRVLFLQVYLTALCSPHLLTKSGHFFTESSSGLIPRPVVQHPRPSCSHPLSTCQTLGRREVLGEGLRPYPA